jgi:hypothetical protein
MHNLNYCECLLSNRLECDRPSIAKGLKYCVYGTIARRYCSGPWKPGSGCCLSKGAQLAWENPGGSGIWNGEGTGREWEGEDSL